MSAPDPLGHFGAQIGDLLAGKYRVTRVLGKGGMGVVVAAHHEVLDQQVALKFILPEAAQDERTRVRFLREARALAKLKSEHVARVLDVGTLETGAPYIVMELLEGEDLAKVARRPEPLPPVLVVDCILQALDALAEAHSLGIVHRDLKPANLFLAARPGGSPVIKVLDFGISKSSSASSGEEAEQDLTLTSTMLGSPLYMSPEQVKSAKHVDPRSDLWAIGVIMYKLLTKKPPFAGATMGETFAAILDGGFVPLDVARPDLPPGLGLVVERLLQKRPDARYASAGELAGALAPFGSGVAAGAVKRAMSLARPGVVVSEETPMPSSAAMSPPSTTGAGMAASQPDGGRTESPWTGSMSSPGTTGWLPHRVLVGVSASLAVVVVGLIVGGGLFIRSQHAATIAARPTELVSAPLATTFTASTAPSASSAGSSAPFAPLAATTVTTHATDASVIADPPKPQHKHATAGTSVRSGASTAIPPASSKAPAKDVWER